MYKVIIFPSKEIADEMILDVAVTPNQYCWMWKDPDATYEEIDPETEEVTIKQCPNIISYNISLDGRCAIAHDFTQEDLEWLQEYWADGEGTYLNGVLFLNSLLGDWQEDISV